MYGTAAAFRTYHEARGRTIPVAWTDTSIEAALLVSSEWIDDKYDDVFVGFKTDGYTQTRAWPRSAAYSNTYPVYVFDEAEIPQDVIDATYEAAWREANTPESLNADFTPSKYNSVAIDGALDVEYNNSIDAGDVQLQIVKVEAILRPLFDPLKRQSGLSGSTSR